MVVGEALRLAGIGAACGAVVAVGVGRWVPGVVVRRAAVGSARAGRRPRRDVSGRRPGDQVAGAYRFSSGPEPAAQSSLKVLCILK